MTGFENLLVALLFLLPGFLTSRLISARTPALGKEASDFQDTLESLLRSVYIHLFNPSCYLPEEIEAASQYKQSDLEFKTSGSDSMDGFWQ